MNKNEFLRQLEALLYDLPEEERREAMEYYVEYFEEAGPEAESEVIKKLGSPKEVAHNIREELAGKELVSAGEGGSKESDKKKTEGWKIALIVVLCIFAAPIAIPLVIGVIAIIVALIATVFSALIGFTAAVLGITLAFAVCFLILLIVGMIKLFGTPLVGLLLIGIALMCGGVSLLAGFLLFKFCVIVLPAICKGIVHLVKIPFQKKEVA